jgi:arabinose-5-phosphate isomerase
MGEKKIWDLPVLDSNNRLVGLLHLHPAIEKLINA